MSNHIVVGANFGDEGKGLATNFLAENLDDNIVVRFNGGGQAAHTVELDDGRRHIFHHISSGSFQGSPTFLTEHFIVNPKVLIKELLELPTESPRVYSHSKAMLVTPYDWLLNRAVEKKRGNERHGSTGMGINETVTRNLAGFKTTVADLYNLLELQQKLKRIEEEYVPRRAKELGVSSELSANIYSYLADCQVVARRIITPVNNYNLLKAYKNRIFEGAQGLLLDEYHYYFPYVTRSRTGSTNAIKVLKDIGEQGADIHYVTRTYTTRHGAGPLDYENEIDEKEDITNIPNLHQGDLRFAPLNLNLLKQSIIRDTFHQVNFNARPNFMVTWGLEKDMFVSGKEYYDSKDLKKELKRILPGMKQTWFEDKTASSLGEIVI